MRLLCPLACVLLFACSSASSPNNDATDDGGAQSPSGSSEQPGAPSFGGDAGGASNGGGATGADGGHTSGDAGSGAADGGPTPVPIGDAGSMLGAFAGAPPYVATLGPSARNPKHAGSNPAGTPCLTCHDGQKGVVAFLFGGTVWKDSAATTPAPSIEVRVLGANNVGIAAYSDADGNFFYPLSAQQTSISAPAHAGMRNATTTQNMTNLINDANCNECHRAGGEARLSLQ